MKFLAVLICFVTLTLLVCGHFDDERELTKLNIQKTRLEIEKLQLELKIYREQDAINATANPF